MQTLEITFKSADAGDVDLLAEFVREFYEFDGHGFDEGVARPALRQILSDHSLGRVWLIEVDGSAVGYVVLTLGFSLMYLGRDAFVDEIYVRENYRGRGVGRRGLEFVEGVCRELGVRALHLEVGRANANAQAVYRRAGFADHDSFLMTKWLG